MVDIKEYMNNSPLPKYSLDELRGFFKEFYDYFPRHIVPDIPGRGAALDRNAILFYTDTDNNKKIYVKKPLSGKRKWLIDNDLNYNCPSCTTNEFHFLRTFEPIHKVLMDDLSRENRLIPKWRIDDTYDEEIYVSAQATGYDFDRSYELLLNGQKRSKEAEMDAEKLVKNAAHMYAMLEFISDIDGGLRHIFIDPESSDFSLIDHTFSYSNTVNNEVYEFVGKVFEIADCIDREQFHQVVFFEHYSEAINSFKKAFSEVDVEVLEHITENSVFTQRRLKGLKDFRTGIDFLDVAKEKSGLKLDYYFIFKDRIEGFNREDGE